MQNVVKSFDELKNINSSKIKMQIQLKDSKDKTFKTLTPQQNKLYGELMYGLKSYSPEELKKLSESKKEKINSRFKKAQLMLNIWKQNLVINYSTFLLEKSNAAPKLIEMFNINSKPSTNFHCQITFKELNVTKTDIVRFFISKKLLPSNFQEV